MNRPPFDLAKVEAATKLGLAHGHRIFQSHFYADTDEGHVDVLLEALGPLPPGSLVLDAGCGIGEVSRLMSLRRPDLVFVLGNISPYQLAHCPNGGMLFPMYMDCHQIPFGEHSFDAVMFSSALCQMDAEVVLREAYRVLQPGGVLLLNEMVSQTGQTDPRLESILACRVPQLSNLLGDLRKVGFGAYAKHPVYCNASRFHAMLEEIGMGSALAGVQSVLIYGVKEDAL